ncbi:hypothetical protein AALO_G00068710 [Alosa alosa]|uniref:NADH dehydrogenase subunit 6 n=1 Tax=Alosa alosa TaxID=278164 RepID=A0AAV6H1L7_9TELE|nr:hypothetical protein AALO_G00068710 [Alosa alosa]
MGLCYFMTVICAHNTHTHTHLYYFLSLHLSLGDDVIVTMSPWRRHARGDIVAVETMFHWERISFFVCLSLFVLAVDILGCSCTVVHGFSMLPFLIYFFVLLIFVINPCVTTSSESVRVTVK